MSAYKTLQITRKKAIQVIMEELLGDIYDDKLEEFMNRILESRLYKVRIVDNNYWDNDDNYL